MKIHHVFTGYRALNLFLKVFFLIVFLGCVLSAMLPPKGKVSLNRLYGVRLDPAAMVMRCRTIPFFAAAEGDWDGTSRIRNGNMETIPVGTQAQTVYLLGMINSWDQGVAHWGEHPELREKREDQIQIGSRLGEIEIVYQDGSSDRIPVITGFTSWFFNAWKHPSHEAGRAIREPFASRSEYMDVLRHALQVKEEGEFIGNGDRRKSYYLAVTPRPLPIRHLAVRSNEEIRGEILIFGVTLELPKEVEPAGNLVAFGKQTVDRQDAQAAFASDRVPDPEPLVKALSEVLYNSEADLPAKVDYPEASGDFRGAQIRFLSDKPEGAMLSNIWTANLANIDEKFEKSGFFYETGERSPFYGGYQGIGTWEPVGIYRQAYGRTADHYVRLALRCAEDAERTTAFVDFCDKWLYFYRHDHDPANGPDNTAFAAERYPADAPPHWSFVLYPPQHGTPNQINEIPGAEELEAHASVMVNRWYAWKLLGMPTGEWLTASRDSVYRKSRWQTTKDAADFICWLMDRTGMDVIYSEGEFTGWSGGGRQIPPGMSTETDMRKIRANYANSDMYEVYASYSSMTALECSADIAEEMGDKAPADQYRSYAGRIRAAMIRLLAHGPDHNRMWRVARNSVLPSLQDCLIHIWFGLYREGLDPKKMDAEMTQISRNTLTRQLNQRYGDAPVLAMGYGIGWLTHSALVLDQMDHAGQLLANIARYTYDKNMDYADPSRGIDWRRWLWIIPEGVNIMPDGRWYRICDLSNGANQGPAMNALEVCAGADDSDNERLRLMPRVADPLTGLDVTGLLVMTHNGRDKVNAHIDYQYVRGKAFRLKSDKALPVTDIRFGPYDSRTQAETVMRAVRAKGDAAVRTEQSGTYHNRPAWWVWTENIVNLREYNLEIEGL
ncbi:MAG: hypothetical protein LBF05_06300 [Tannerella sp.]|jgi:hypothetical protein|nr:hypothetical protein [Tannerella sp.]